MSPTTDERSLDAAPNVMLGVHPLKDDVGAENDCTAAPLTYTKMELLLIEGAKHTFVTEHPFEKGSIKAMKAATAFIKKHGGGAA